MVKNIKNTSLKLEETMPSYKYKNKYSNFLKVVKPMLSC